MQASRIGFGGDIHLQARRAVSSAYLRNMKTLLAKAAPGGIDFFAKANIDGSLNAKAPMTITVADKVHKKIERLLGQFPVLKQLQGKERQRLVEKPRSRFSA